MSMLGSQCDELRKKADMLDGLEGMDNLVRMLREAADTIENLRNRLQPVPAELDYIEDKSRWYQLFGSPEQAARTLIVVREECEDIGTCYPNCPFDDAPACPSSVEPRDNDALLEWLRGDAE